MGLLSWTIGLPLQPVRGVVALGQVIQRQVDAEQRSAPSVRRRLEQLEREREQEPERVTDEQERQAMREITGARVPPAAPKDESPRDESPRDESPKGDER